MASERACDHGFFGVSARCSSPPARRPGGWTMSMACSYCCAGLTAILLVIGVMDLRAMAVVTAAITVERFAPAPERVARVIGGGVVGAGLFVIAKAAGLA